MNASMDHSNKHLEKTMKFNSLCLLTAFAFFSGTSFGAEFIYRDLMANTLPPPACASKSEAIAKTSQTYYINRYTKQFCETQGYGWGLEEVKSIGKAVCEECVRSNKGEYQCHLEDVVVTCRRLKPGSVGLIPGQG